MKMSGFMTLTTKFPAPVYHYCNTCLKSTIHTHIDNEMICSICKNNLTILDKPQNVIKKEYF